MERRAEISDARKLAFYAGLGLTILGFLVFVSLFFVSAPRQPLSSFPPGFPGAGLGFEDRSKSFAARGITGMGMIILGGILMGIGRAGLAGSGIVLDPRQARTDLEPWSRMTGGMVKDALDEAGIAAGQKSATNPLPFDEQLRRLHKLREDGIVTEAEYEAKKKQILSEA